MPQGKISEENERLTIVVPKDVKSKAQKIAKEEGDTLSGWLRRLIISTVKVHENGDTLK